VLDLSPSHRALDTFQQRFLAEGLGSAVSPKAFAAFDPLRYSPEQLSFARADWESRTLDEYRSQVAFTELLMELTEVGFSYDALGTCIRVVRDESRHVELCKRMLNALGGTDQLSGEPHWVRSDKTLPTRYRVLNTLISSLCIGETLSVNVLIAVRDNTTDELARAVTTQLAADESIHSRFGWSLLELFTPEMESEERAWVNELLPGIFYATEQAVRVEASDVFSPLSPFGAISNSDRNALLYRTFEKDIVEPFEKLGFRAVDAWEKRATIALAEAA
jgi:hypothetical protein